MMDTFWNKHAFLTEAYIDSILTGETDSFVILEQLFSNKNVIDSVWSLYLKPENHDNATHLLKLHIRKTVDMINSILKRGRLNPSTTLSMSIHKSSGDLLAKALTEGANVTCAEKLLRKQSEILVTLTVAKMRKEDNVKIAELRRMYYDIIKDLKNACIVTILTKS